MTEILYWYWQNCVYALSIMFKFELLVFFLAPFTLGRIELWTSTTTTVMIMTMMHWFSFLWYTCLLFYVFVSILFLFNSQSTGTHAWHHFVKTLLFFFSNHHLFGSLSQNMLCKFVSFILKWFMHAHFNNWASLEIFRCELQIHGAVRKCMQSCLWKKK